jgi:hypothetical protein
MYKLSRELKYIHISYLTPDSPKFLPKHAQVAVSVSKEKGGEEFEIFSSHEKEPIYVRSNGSRKSGKVFWQNFLKTSS